MNFLESIDQSLLNSLHMVRTSWLKSRWLDSLVLALTELGGLTFLAGVVVVFTVLLLWRRNTRAALLLVAAFASSLLLEGMTKPLIGRVPPDIGRSPASSPASPSFPSDHALGAMCVYVSVALLVGPLLRLQRARRNAVAAALLFAFLIGVSQLYLGTHYLTDVLAGWTAGLALAMIVRELRGETVTKEFG